MMLSRHAISTLLSTLTVAEEACYKRGISYEGDELPELEIYSSLTEEERDYKYAYRDPDVCVNRCREYE